MKLLIFNNLREEDKAKAIEKLISNSSPRQDFYFMTILAVIMATFGLIINNTAIIIGSMLVAPMLYPILALSLGVVLADGKLISRSFYTIIKSMGLSIIAAAIITLLFSGQNVDFDHQSLFTLEYATIYVAVAIVAGFAASFALIKPHLNSTLPGTSIAITLIPPLASIGIGIAKLDWKLITNSVLIFTINVIGIIFASMIVYSLMNLYVKRNIADKALDKDEADIAKEIKIAEANSKKLSKEKKHKKKKKKSTKAK